MCVYVTQHYGARPTHALWQGKVYSKSGTSDKYPDLVKSTGYGTITGLGGVNCRHFIQTFIDGITNIPTELDIKENERIYNLTQEQRSYERDIRKSKKKLAVSKYTNDIELIGVQKKVLFESQDKLINFLNKHEELKIDYFRSQVNTDSITDFGLIDKAKLHTSYKNEIVNIKMANRNSISSLSWHAFEQMINRNISISDITYTLKNPLKYGKIKSDKQGRKSYKIIGEKSTIAVNPNTGVIITVHGTHTSLVNKLKGQKNDKV